MTRLLVVLFFIPLIANSQESLDSLLFQLNQSAHDSTKARVLLELSTKAYGITLDSSLHYARKAYALSSANNFNNINGLAQIKISRVLLSKGMADSALIYANNALEIFQNLDDSLNIAGVLEMVGVAKERTGDYKGAQENYFLSLEISERNNYVLPQIEALNDLAVYSLGQRDVPLAIKYLERSLALAEENNLANKIVRACINLSVAHDSIKIRQGYLDRAMSLAIPMNMLRETAYIYGAQAILQYNQEKYTEAIETQRKQIRILEKMGDISGITRSKRSISYSLIELGRNAEAEKELKDVLSNPNYQDFKTLPYLSLEYLANALYNQNKYQEAFDTMYSAYNIAKEVYEQNIKDNAADANVKYETLQKEEEIARQELEITKQKVNRNKIAGIGGFLLLMSIGAGLWYYQKQTAKKKIAELALSSEKKEREKLQELDELKTRFFTNVSHELKTPLTLILGPLANTLEKINNEDVRQDILLAFNNAERLHDLINETLDFSKLESGKLVIENSPVLISETLKRSFLSFQSLAEMKNIRLRFQSSIPDDAYISCDYGKLEKIVNNLVSNAIKFSNNNSLVTLTANMDDDLIIQVADQGKGVPVEEQEKIFNRFYQAKHNQYGNYGGTGVGLAFSKELTEVLGGKLTVNSKKGEGSTFILSLPVEKTLAPDKSTAVSQPDAEHKPMAYESLLIDGEKPSVLIVEDNPEMQGYLKSILQEHYLCASASDGYEAIRMVQKNTFHLITSDIMMPNMDGFRLKEEINKISGYSSIPFIFLSARSQDEDILEGLQLGVDDYITKPFNKQEYLTRIYNLLRNRKERLASIESYGSNKNTESVDVKILKDAERTILENLSNTQFKVADLADALHYSQRQLGRIIKQLTGMSPIELILELRLQKAHRLIKRKQYASISEVRYEVGIESPSYFARKFKERFGVSPSEV